MTPNNVEVTSVTKRSQSLVDTAAAVYVISNEDIRSSGVNSIPDALRLAPGLQVAKSDANKWAISVRGHNSRFGNKLLVLIDGRSVYSSTYSGVFWEAQDAVLDDIDRIEVIRGPGAALWGSNAVNGVINLITKNSADTRGQRLLASVSDSDSYTGSWRLGGSIDDKTHYRVYGKQKSYGNSELLTGGDAVDEWEMQQLGFRLDSQTSGNSTLTLMGDIYQGDIDQDRYDLMPTSPQFPSLVDADADQKGANLKLGYNRKTDLGEQLSVQFFYDRAERSEDFLDENWGIYSLDMNYSLAQWRGHRFTFGVGYTVKYHDAKNSGHIDFLEESSSVESADLYFQDSLSLLDDKLTLLVGAKIEHNDLSNEEIEFQPNFRVSYHLDEQRMVWGGVSRAARMPSMVEGRARVHLGTYTPPQTPVTTVITGVGDERLEPELVTAYELGYRQSAGSDVYIDIALFYNDYSNLRSTALGTMNLLPMASPPGFYVQQEVLYRNQETSYSRGIEIAVDWQYSDRWTLSGNYSYISMTPEGTTYLGPTNPAEHIVNVRSMLELSEDLDLDVWVRYASELEGSEIDAYTDLNVRLAWQVTTDLELALVADNLLGNHQEYVHEVVFSPDTEQSRSVTAEIAWSF